MAVTRLRVVQWTTGKTGRAAVRGLVDNPMLDLVGCYAWSAGKVGRDVGDLCRIDPIGVTATDDIDALLALEPDCVVYTPYRPDTDHLVRILESGCNVVTSMYQLIGRGYGDDAYKQIAAATERGGSSLYASGTYPGYVGMVALATTAVSSRARCRTRDMPWCPTRPLPPGTPRPERCMKPNPRPPAAIRCHRCRPVSMS